MMPTKFLILDKCDLIDLVHDQMVRVPADDKDNMDIVILSEEAYRDYSKTLKEED